MKYRIIYGIIMAMLIAFVTPVAAVSMVITVPTTISSDIEVGSLESLVIMAPLTIASGTTITNNGVIMTTGSGSINIDNGCSIVNNKQISNMGIRITNDGSILNNLVGTITNSRDIINNGIIDNYGLIANVYTAGDIKNYGTMNNYGTIDNFLTIHNDLGGTINNLCSGIINNLIPQGTNIPGVILGGYTDNTGDCTNAIPEFPTVALPIIAVMGLMFMFQRRKGK